MLNVDQVIGWNTNSFKNSNDMQPFWCFGNNLVNIVIPFYIIHNNETYVMILSLGEHNLQLEA